MVGDEHADAALDQVPDNALDVDHRQRIDAREGLIQQHEARFRRERATLAGLSGASLCVVVLGMVALRSMPERQPAPHQVDSGIAASGGK